MPDVSRCRSCNAKVVWMKTHTGKAIPVDLDSIIVFHLYAAPGHQNEPIPAKPGERYEHDAILVDKTTPPGQPGRWRPAPIGDMATPEKGEVRMTYKKTVGPDVFDRLKHTTHFATCPNAKKHRNKGGS